MQKTARPEDGGFCSENGYYGSEAPRCHQQDKWRNEIIRLVQSCIILYGFVQAIYKMMC
jgi:hypothetical protein